MLNPGILLKFPLKNLNKMGFLTTNGISRTAFPLTYFILLLFSIVLMLMQFFYMNDDITSYVNNVEGLTVYLQTVIKVILLVYNKNHFLNLVTIMKQFWSDDQSSVSTQNDVNIITKRVLLLQNIFYYGVLGVVGLITLASIIQKNLIIGVWQMEKNGVFKLAWILIFTITTISAYFNAFYDCLYLGFCYELVMQSKILYSHLEQLNTDVITCESQFRDYYKKFNTYIKYHALLIEYHEELQKTYSISLLVQYLAAAPLICVEMYALTEISDPLLLIRYAVSIFNAILQSSFYCIPANYVEDEMSTISTAIYNSDWCSKHFLMMRTPIILMIQRAQKSATLNACGLININIDVLVNLIKLAYTICVALKGFKNST